MSLLQKASIITTPTAYAEDYLYSIKPAYALGSELIVNGNFANGTTNWTATNAVISASDYVLTVDDSANAGGDSRATQSFTTRVGFTYKVRFNRVSTTSTFFLGIGGGTGYNNVFYSDLGTDLGFYERTFVATSTTSRIALITGGTGISKFSDVSVKEVTDADFDFDRNSTGTRVNEDYVIEDVPYNLVSYSEDLSQFTKVNATVTTNQTLAPNGTLTADKIVFNGTANARVEQNLSATIINTNYSAGAVNTQSVFLKTESGTANIDIGLAGHDTTTVIVTSEWKRFTHTGTGTFPRMKSDSAVTIFAWGVQVAAGSKPKDYLKTTDRLDIPRIDYTNGEPSILLEPQRQNLITYSQDYSQWSNQTAPTVTSNFGISPEGITNADKITASSNTSAKYIGFTLSTSTVHTGSVFLKNIDSTQSRLEVYAASWAYPNFEISWNGYIPSTLSSNNVSNIQYQEYTNNWWRVSYQFTTDSSITSYNTYIYPDRVNASKSILAFGSQLEVGSYATSLIHTSGSAVTRSADAANNAGNSDLFNDNEGVLYCEIKATANDSSQRRITISDGSLNNRIGIEYTSSSNQIRGRVTDGGSGQADMTYTAIDITEYLKIAIKYKVNDCALYVNGQEVVVDTSATMPSGLDKLSFDQATSVLNYYGNVKSVMVFKEALTDLELEKLTGYNNHELYMNYYNRLSYLGLAEEYNVESDINNYIL